MILSCKAQKVTEELIESILLPAIFSRSAEAQQVNIVIRASSIARFVLFFLNRLNKLLEDVIQGYLKLE